MLTITLEMLPDGWQAGVFPTAKDAYHYELGHTQVFQPGAKPAFGFSYSWHKPTVAIDQALYNYNEQNRNA